MSFSVSFIVKNLWITNASSALSLPRKLLPVGVKVVTVSTTDEQELLQWRTKHLKGGVAVEGRNFMTRFNLKPNIG